MVLNLKAELAAKVARTAKIRYERMELCGIVVVLTASLVLGYQLYSSMVDGWQEHRRTRWHVLALSISLLVLSIIACVYLCHRLHLQPTVRLQSARPRTLVSVNSQLHLIGFERPPSYDTATRGGLMGMAPPAYNTVFNV